MPTAARERMSSFTLCRARAGPKRVSLSATDADVSRSAGTSTPRPASSPSVARTRSAIRSLRPGRPFQRPATASRPRPSSPSCLAASVAFVGSATSRTSSGEPARLGVGGGRVGRAGGAAGDGRAEGAGVDELGEALPDRLHLVFLEGGLRPLGVPTAEHELVHVDVERHVAHERDEPRVAAGEVLVGLEVLAQLGRLLLEVGEHPVEVAVLVDQLGGGLLPHPGDARQVVRRVAAQGGEQDVLLRRHPGALGDAGLVVERVVAHAPLVVEDPDVGVPRAGSCRGRR